MPRFPPDPDEVLRRLFEILRPPRLPKFFPREEGPPRRHRIVATTGSKLIWPYRIVWKESPAGRGQIKVLREEHTLGVVSYMDRGERNRIVSLLENIFKGEII